MTENKMKLEELLVQSIEHQTYAITDELHNKNIDISFIKRRLNQILRLSKILASEKARLNAEKNR